MTPIKTMRGLPPFTLVQQFNALCIASLILFGLLFASIVSRAVEENLVSRASELTAGFVQYEVRQALYRDDADLSNENMTPSIVAQRMPSLYFGPDIVRVKVWNASAQIVWSNEQALIGKQFADNNEVKRAFAGAVVSEISETSEPEHEHERQYRRLMELYVPIHLPHTAKIPLVVEVYQGLDTLYADIHRYRLRVWVSTVLGFIGVYVVLLGIMLRASKTMRIQTENLIQSREKLIQADKLVSLGQLSAGVAHEINNPNQRILLQLTLFERAWVGIRPILDKYFEQNGDFSVSGVPYSKIGPRMPQAFENMRKASNRITTIVKELSDFARRKPSSSFENIDVNRVVKSATFLTRKMITESTDHFSLRVHKYLPPIKGNEQRLEQVLVNLLINACQAVSDRSKRMNVATGYDVENRQIIIKVRDEGNGISDADLPRIFDPFFTTRAEFGGTGLGLAISQSIIVEHGGTIQFRSTPGKGTTVTIVLPVPDDIRPGTATSTETEDVSLDSANVNSEVQVQPNATEPTAR